MFTKEDAVIVVDYQKDFLPGGPLGVKGGDSIATAINRLMQASPLTVATRDWHPKDHCSFSDQPEFKDGSWPVHCLAGSDGAMISEKIDGRYIKIVFKKGHDSARDAYSGFDGTDLAEYLRNNGVKHVFICGLATDYCVKATALDALKEGFHVTLVLDAVAAVDIPEGSGQRAIDDMHDAGVNLSNSLDVVCHD